MTADGCPELEVLFAELAQGRGPSLEHAKRCPACSALLEDHRQLEKDLFRLADPLPPPDLVHKVMARVALEPRPQGSEVKVGLAILVAAVVLAVIGFAGGGTGAGVVGTEVASFAVEARSLLSALRHSLVTLWQTAGVPLTFGSLALLFVTLFGLRRLASGGPEEARA